MARTIYGIRPSQLTDIPHIIRCVYTGRNHRGVPYPSTFTRRISARMFVPCLLSFCSFVAAAVPPAWTTVVTAGLNPVELLWPCSSERLPARCQQITRLHQMWHIVGHWRCQWGYHNRTLCLNDTGNTRRCTLSKQVVPTIQGSKHAALSSLDSPLWSPTAVHVLKL